MNQSPPSSHLGEIYNMFYYPEDIHTHYTPSRYLTTLSESYYYFKNHLPYFKYYMFEICYLNIQGKIIQEQQQNDYEDFYDICYRNLLCRKNFKKSAIYYLQLINQQLSYHYLCLKKIKKGSV